MFLFLFNRLCYTINVVLHSTQLKYIIYNYPEKIINELQCKLFLMK